MSDHPTPPFAPFAVGTVQIRNRWDCLVLLLHFAGVLGLHASDADWVGHGRVAVTFDVSDD